MHVHARVTVADLSYCPTDARVALVSSSDGSSHTSNNGRWVKDVHYTCGDCACESGRTAKTVTVDVGVGNFSKCLGFALQHFGIDTWPRITTFQYCWDRGIRDCLIYFKSDLWIMLKYLLNHASKKD